MLNGKYSNHPASPAVGRESALAFLKTLRRSSRRVSCKISLRHGRTFFVYQYSTLLENLRVVHDQDNVCRPSKLYATARA
jgi:hypothetical protein